jgi:hypothetical protein
MAVTINASTSSGLVQSADTSGEINLQSNGTTRLSVLSTGVSGTLVQGTAVTASGTSIDFTGIPSWVKRITVMFQGVSTNGVSIVLIQLGSGSAETTGYLGAGVSAAGAVATSNFTTGFGLGATGNTAASTVRQGAVIINLIGSNVWACMGSVADSGNAASTITSGTKTTSGTLDRIRITTVNGTDTFDAGTINLQYEG